MKKLNLFFAFTALILISQFAISCNADKKGATESTEKEESKAPQKKEPVAKKTFKLDFDAIHYIVLKEGKGVHDLKLKTIRSYFKDNFDQRVKVAKFSLDDEHSKIYFSIMKFDNMTDGQNFLNTAYENDLLDKNSIAYLMSQANYRIFVTNDMVDEYDKFYQKHYVKK